MAGGTLSLSKIILPHVTGVGTTTLNPPTGDNNYTLQLPNASGTLMLGTPPAGNIVGTTDNQTLTNKTLINPYFNNSQLATVLGLAPGYLCRAWVNFNGTGTVAIRASGNISSITDNGVGIYTLNFTVAMPDTNYMLFFMVRRTAASALVSQATMWSTDEKTTTSVRIRTSEGNTGGLVDLPEIGIGIIR